jgi:hypothetical protein
MGEHGYKLGSQAKVNMVIVCFACSFLKPFPELCNMVPMHLLNLVKTELDEPICQIVQLLLLHTVSAFCHSFPIGTVLPKAQMLLASGLPLLGFWNCGLRLKHASKIFGALETMR